MAMRSKATWTFEDWLSPFVPGHSSNVKVSTSRAALAEADE